MANWMRRGFLGSLPGDSSDNIARSSTAERAWTHQDHRLRSIVLDIGVFSAEWAGFGSAWCPRQLLGIWAYLWALLNTYDEDEEGHILMGMAEQMNFTARLFLSGIENWKKKFELGGRPDTRRFLIAPSFPRSCLLYREGMAAFDAEDYVKCIHVLVPQVEEQPSTIAQIRGRARHKDR